jgi:hypothetical protein
MGEELKGAPESPIGAQGLDARRDSDGGYGGHQLDRHLKGLGRGPGKVFENHHGHSIASKRSVPDREK